MPAAMRLNRMAQGKDLGFMGLQERLTTVVVDRGCLGAPRE